MSREKPPKRPPGFFKGTEETELELSGNVVIKRDEGGQILYHPKISRSPFTKEVRDEQGRGTEKEEPH